MSGVSSVHGTSLNRQLRLVSTVGGCSVEKSSEYDAIDFDTDEL